MLQIGSIIDGKYKILSKIGQGGMSVVYMAINERANKTWAIKEIRRDGVQDYEVVKQGLIVETDMLKRLNHPNLPSIIDVIEEEDTFLIVMDYIEGKPLSSALREFGAQDQDQVIRWSRQLCDVLGYLHSREPAIIYRDMKPSNVMLKPDGNVVLIDFGIAREFKRNHVADTTCLGTKGYAAPEQYGGMGQTDARTDIYCLGATMYHLLTGHNPSEPPYEMYPIRYWNPSLSSGLEEIILKCTQQNPDDRFQSCAELMYALDHYQELDQEYRRHQSRRWGAFLAGSILTVVTAAGAAGFRMAELSTMQNSYDQYMESAAAEEDPGEQYDLYMNAIKLQPENEKPYLQVISDFLQDGEFTDSEDRQFREMMGASKGEERSNRDYLKENEEGYHKVCYQAAMAYFYYYKGGLKSKAREWLKTVQDSPYLENNERERVGMLYQISEYYDGLGNGAMSITGDASTSYKDYWNDLVTSTEENLVEKDNVMTALVIYRELVNQINMDCDKFKSAGITKDQIEEQMSNVRSRMEDDIQSVIDDTGNDDTRDMLTEIKDQILTNLEMAERLVRANFKEIEENSEEGT